MKWIKKNWSNCLSILAIILSIYSIFQEPLTLPDSWLSGVLGISISIISIGVVTVLGYQIYNSVTLDKRMNEMFNEKTEKIRESLSIGNIRSVSAALYQTEGVSLKLSMALNDIDSALRTLHSQLDYAKAINDPETLNDIARLIVNTKIISDKKKLSDTQSDSSFLILAQTVLTQLSGDDDQVPRLYDMIKQIQSDLLKTQSCPKEEQKK